MNKDKFIAEKLGVCWHPAEKFIHMIEGHGYCEICKNKVHHREIDKNPDFTSEAGRVKLLKLMEKHKDYFDFINTVGRAVPQFSTVACFISTDYIADETGKFRDAVYKWLGGEE